jgi:hypothetical protein
MGEITCGARRLLLAALVSLLGLQLALQLPRVLAESADAAVRFGEPSAGRGTMPPLATVAAAAPAQGLPSANALEPAADSFAQEPKHEAHPKADNAKPSWVAEQPAIPAGEPVRETIAGPAPRRDVVPEESPLLAEHLPETISPAAEEPAVVPPRWDDGIYVDAALYMRVWRTDDSNILRWLEWQRYIGVDHVLMYDTGFPDKNDPRIIDVPGVQELVDRGYVTVVKFPMVMKAPEQQKPFIRDVNEKFPAKGWRLFLDFDEFVFSPRDTEPGFLRRRLAKLDKNVAILFLHNYIFGGWKEPQERMRILPHGENVSYRTHSRPEYFCWRRNDKDSRQNKLTKFVARPPHCSFIGIHTAKPAAGYKELTAEGSDIRFNHYWGPRVKIERAKEKGFVEDRSILPSVLRAIGILKLSAVQQ